MSVPAVQFARGVARSRTSLRSNKLVEHVARRVLGDGREGGEGRSGGEARGGETRAEDGPRLGRGWAETEPRLG